MGTEWRWSSIIVVAAVAWLIVLALAVHPALAGGTVGTGSPASCTEAALDIALGGGGTVTFNCGAAPHTITLSSYKSIGANTTILGGGKITLSGGGSIPHFQIFNGYALTLNGITLSHGSGLFGSIQNFGTLVVSDSVLADNVASVDGGAIDNSNGRVDMTGVRLIRNRSVGDGGALFNDGGVVTLSAVRWPPTQPRPDSAAASTTSMADTWQSPGARFTAIRPTGSVRRLVVAEASSARVR